MTFSVETTGGRALGISIIPPLDKKSFIFLPFDKGGIIFPPLEKGGEGGLKRRTRDMELLAIYKISPWPLFAKEGKYGLGRLKKA